MDDATSPRFLQPIVDARPLFIRAVSLCAELEGLCACEGSTGQLGLVGLARGALTQFGRRSTPHFEVVGCASIMDGLRELQCLVTRLLREADDDCYGRLLTDCLDHIRDAQRCA